MRLLASFLVLSIGFGCQSSNDNEQDGPRPSLCNLEVNSSYLESTDAVQNQAIIDSLSSRMVEITAQYQQSHPSNMNWSIQENKLRFDEKTYSLRYSSENASWDVINENGAMVGSLAPYKTSNCELVSQLKLSMFIPSEEEAVADIAYATL